MPASIASAEPRSPFFDVPISHIRDLPIAEAAGRLNFRESKLVRRPTFVLKHDLCPPRARHQVCSVLQWQCLHHRREQTGSRLKVSRSPVVNPLALNSLSERKDARPKEN